MVKQNSMEGFNPIRWAFIVIYLILTVTSVFWHSPLAWDIVPIVLVFSIFIAVLLHGKERYGIKTYWYFLVNFLDGGRCNLWDPTFDINTGAFQCLKSYGNL
ncbi:hypothetical protein [Legionella tunisiensis]|uniref:hypothetical protein n=1 Tax=Legionella tunisiensis TaxID=1034944 RepID=UPI0002D4C005|nr:hypothetical protein [Legionella tunisiensis]